MAAIQQSDVNVNNCNAVIAFVQALAVLRVQAAALVAVNAVNPLGDLWANMNTTALNKDGSLGTADTPGTPVETDYLDSRLYPALLRVCKPGDLTNGLQAVVDFNTFCAGTAVAANGARPANINALAM